MPLTRNSDGTWEATVTAADEAEGGEHNPVYVESLQRYLNEFDRLFGAAQARCELEFLFSLFRVRGIEDPGWDPYETTRASIPAIVRVHESLSDEQDQALAARHLGLWLYGHIVEASEPYELIANLLNVANGSAYLPSTNFPDRRPGVPEGPGNKIRMLKELATATGMPGAVTPLTESWNRDVRNAVFHADYTLYADELRLARSPERLSFEERQGLINRALANHTALETVFSVYVSAYEEPKTIPTSPHFGGPPGLEWVVIVRTGHGAVGVKDAWDDHDEEAGRLPLRVGRFYPDEIKLLSADRGLALLPARI